jgi:hypothetical protein
MDFGGVKNGGIRLGRRKKRKGKVLFLGAWIGGSYFFVEKRGAISWTA